MINRLAIVLYIFLHFPLVFIFAYSIMDSYYLETIGVEYFHVRCLSNDKLVVLQGDTEPLEVGGALYKNRYSSEIAKNWVTQEEETSRFYCAYYDQIQPYIARYQAATTREEEVAANIAWNEFRTQYEAPYIRNYELELIRTENDWMGLVYMIGYAFLSTLFYFVGLQIVRIIYQYIVYGRFNWHPYRKVIKE